MTAVVLMDMNDPRITVQLMNAPVYTQTTPIRARRITAPEELPMPANYGFMMPRWYTVESGEWIITLPSSKQISMSNTEFQFRYTPTADESFYISKGHIRAFRSDFHSAINVDTPWGGTQMGDQGVVVAVDSDENGTLGKNRWLIESIEFDEVFDTPHDFMDES